MALARVCAACLSRPAAPESTRCGACAVATRETPAGLGRDALRGIATGVALALALDSAIVLMVIALVAVLA